MIFLSIRNFATCFALGVMNQKIFSRNSALLLGDFKLNIDNEIYNLLEKSRLFSTRGIEVKITENMIYRTKKELTNIDKWFDSILKSIKNDR